MWVFARMVFQSSRDDGNVIGLVVRPVSLSWLVVDGWKGQAVMRRTEPEVLSPKPCQLPSPARQTPGPLRSPARHFPFSYATVLTPYLARLATQTHSPRAQTHPGQDVGSSEQ